MPIPYLGESMNVPTIVDGSYRECARCHEVKECVRVQLGGDDPRLIFFADFCWTDYRRIVRSILGMRDFEFIRASLIQAANGRRQEQP
jgi:hypothetical protein